MSYDSLQSTTEAHVAVVVVVAVVYLGLVVLLSSRASAHNGRRCDPIRCCYLGAERLGWRKEQQR